MAHFEFIKLAQATWETIYIVYISSVLSLTLGLGLGVYLYLTKKNQALSNPVIHRIISWIVNATRSVPFIILLISVIPLTQLIVGTTIGINAAIVPLTLAATAFFARVCEVALLEAPDYLYETAQAMGATTWQYMTRFLIPESLSALIQGATLTVIGIIGYSAMAGTVGGGGLGELAIQFGYQRFNLTVMIETVALLIIIVQVTQFVGDRLSETKRLKTTGCLALLFGLFCIGTQCWPHTLDTTPTVTLGIMSGTDLHTLDVAQHEALTHFGFKLTYVTFDDYVQPNVALNEGHIDANMFQHVPYLNAQLKDHHYEITPIGKTFVYPFGFYSKSIHTLKDLKAQALIAIPNDPSNEGRALLLLAHQHLITLKPGVGLFATPGDVQSNPLHLQFITLDAAQIPRALDHVALGGLTQDYTKRAGFVPSQAVLLENADSPYANVIVAQTIHKNDPLLKDLVAVIHSPAYVKATRKAYPHNAAVPAF